jgi:hypothetical protein
MTRTALAALAAFALLAAPAHAVKRGTFAGSTSEGDPLGFKVDRKGRVVAFHFEEVSLSCSDGDTVSTPRIVTPAGERFAVRSGRFGISSTNAVTGFGWDAKGTFRSRGRRATGTLRVRARFNERNEQDADGSIRCASASLTWSARRR